MGPVLSTVRIRIALVVTMAVWGLNLSAVKVLTGQFDTLTLASMRMILATIAMTLFAAPHLPSLRRLTRAQCVRLAACAALMVYGNQMLMLTGMRATGATNAALVVGLSPLMGLLVAAVFLRERLGRLSALGVFIGFAGVAIATLGEPGSEISAVGSGDVLLLLSVVVFAIGGALVQGLARELDTAVISWAIHAIGAIMLTLHAGTSISRELVSLGSLGPWMWALLLFSGAVATGLGNLVWNRSIASIGVGSTTSAIYWVPVFGIGFAVAALGEALSHLHVVALSTVLLGTWVSSRAHAGAPKAQPWR